MRRAMRAAALAGWFLLLPGIAQAAEVQVQVVAPTAGQTVGRSVAIEAVTVGPVTSVTFEVSADGGATWTLVGTDTEPSDGWTATWDATGVSGPVTIRATATDGVTSVSAGVDVLVDTAPPALALFLSRAVFSPNGDGRAEQTTARVAVQEDVELTLTLLVPDGRIARRLAVGPIGPGPSTFVWRGDTKAGHTFADGPYVLRAQVVDALGNASEQTLDVVIDTRAPVVRWVSVGPDPYRGVGDVRLTLRASDRSPVLLSSVTLTDASGRRLVRLGPSSFPGGTERFVWDGTGRDGGVAGPGLVTAQASVRDDAGNITASALRAFRDHRPVPNLLIRRVEGAEGRIALTFDDCWNIMAWERILDILEAKHAGGSFFCLGASVGAAPDIARRTVEAGHTIGSHGWDHANVQALSPEAIRRRVRADADVWWRVAHTTPVPFFRPPGGAIDAGAQTVLGGEGFRYTVLWDVDPWDWTNPGAAAVTQRVLAHARSGSIVVLHALDGTAQALPGLIDRLRARGLEPVSLVELLAS